MKEITKQQYIALEEEVEEMRKKAERAKGALDQLMAQLQQDFNCSTVKEAKVLLAKLQKKREETEREFEAAMKDYEKRWKTE